MDSKVFVITICDYCIKTVKSKEVVILIKHCFKTSMKKGKTKQEESSALYQVNHKKSTLHSV